MNKNDFLKHLFITPGNQLSSFRGENACQWLCVFDVVCSLPKLYICESCITYTDSQVSLDRHVVCVSRYTTVD